LSEPRGRLVFEDVTFRYQSGSPPALRGINLTIEQGRPADLLLADGFYAAAHSGNSLLIS
jgi:ABC-type multidrug transport system fused ATPase/permease subunit